MLRDAAGEIERIMENARREIRDMIGRGSEDVRYPAMDMYEDKGNLVIEVDMPGVSRDEINLCLERDCISVSAEKKALREKDEEGFFSRERRWKAMERSAALPVEVDPDRAEAKCEDGTLRVVAPITREKKKNVRKLNIK